jgi:LacI family transcriptional regulator
MNVTLSQIADETGFSINTVSRVLRGDERISMQTSTQIKEVAARLGYVPNYAASSMRSHNTHILGVISADSSNPFFAEVILGVEDTAKQYGYHILLMNTEEKAENECAAIKTLQGRQVDGIISIPLYDEDTTRKLYMELPVPYIFAGRKVRGLENHSILHRDKESTDQIVTWLLENGHNRILYITGPESISNSLDRLCGYVNAYKRAGKEPDKSLIIKTDGHIDDGYGTVNRMLKLQADFTAIVCFNDLVAMGVLKSLYENNLSVPETMEVAGCDNLSISQYMQPRLTTVEVPKYRLGKEAVLELIRHIRNSELPYETRNLDTRLIFRESTRNRPVHT